MARIRTGNRFIRRAINLDVIEIQRLLANVSSIHAACALSSAGMFPQIT